MQLQIIINNQIEYDHILSILSSYFRKIICSIYYKSQEAFITDFDVFTELDKRRFKFHVETITVNYNEFILSYNKVMISPIK